MRTLEFYLSEYAESHQNTRNISIHKVCVPAIYFTVIALLWVIPTPGYWATAVVVLASVFYALLDFKFSIPIIAFSAACLYVCYLIFNRFPDFLMPFGVTVFVIAWIGQFVGHKIEGKKPSFFKDLLFLLIGPLWVLNAFNKKLGFKHYE